jgi:hypothetical protein
VAPPAGARVGGRSIAALDATKAISGGTSLVSPPCVTVRPWRSAKVRRSTADIVAPHFSSASAGSSG